MSGGGAAAKAGIDMLIAGWQSTEQSLNQARLIKAQNKARIKQMQEQFRFDTQNFYNNKIDIKQQKFKNDVLIQESKLDAQDAFAQAFAGSGVSGRSVDLLESEIDRDVSKAHAENLQASTKQRDREFLGLQRTSQAIEQEIRNFNFFDSSAAESNKNMAVMAAGVSSLAKSAGAGAFEGVGDSFAGMFDASAAAGGFG